MNINSFVPNSQIFDKINLGIDKTVSKSNDASKDENSTSGSFLDTLKSKLQEVNDQQVNAENLSEQFVKGDGPDVHELSLAVSEASLSLDMAIQVRNKLVEAYQELNKTQL